MATEHGGVAGGDEDEAAPVQEEKQEEADGDEGHADPEMDGAINRVLVFAFEELDEGVEFGHRLLAGGDPADLTIPIDGIAQGIMNGAGLKT